MKKALRAVDLFCGAGGSSTGARQAGVDVVLAVNHWHVAIQSHRANHPDTRHICARMDDIDPRNDTLPDIDILLASPECTHHSIARGGKPVEDQKRATPWHVCNWVDAKRPKWFVIENVREFRDWGPIHNGKPVKSRKGETFEAWLNSLRALGYTVEHQVLNAADFGAATKRHRLFIIGKRGSNQKIPWPKVTHAGKWRPASEIIDWSRECPSIFGRKRPLADKTIARIESGLRKFVEPFLVKLRGTGTTSPIDQPLFTVTGGGTHAAVAVPFQFKAMGRNPGATKSVDTPQPRHAVVAPFLADVNYGDKGRSPGGRVHPIDEPLGVVTTKRGKSVVLPFLTEYYGTGDASSVDDPLLTVTTKHRHALVAAAGGDGAYAMEDYFRDLRGEFGKSDAMLKLIATMEELGVPDIGFRMLDVDELAAASDFEKDYQLFGTKAEQIKQVGNAVPPCFMRAICGAIQGAA